MKHHLITACLAIFAGLQLNAQTMSELSLQSLWKQHQEASKADLPVKEAEILKQIKQEALEKHLPVDFYKAASEYVNTVQRRDWKQRDKLRKDLQAEVEAFDEPIVTYRWMSDWQNASTDALWAYVKAHEDGFEGCNRPFHTGVSAYLNGALTPLISSDKEYVLLRLFLGRTYKSAQNDEIYQLLKSQVSGKYPAEAAVDYYVANSRYYSSADRPRKMADLKAVQDRYAGTAAALFPEASILQIRKDILDEEHGTSAQYKALWEECKALEVRRKAFTGGEKKIARCCTAAENLIETLTGKNLQVSIEQEEITVVLQNLEKADVSLLRDDKKVKTWKAVNPVNSFYVDDTVKIALPKLPDGTYQVEAVNGKLSDMSQYNQYTLSIATRTDGRGRCVYVTDYKSGIPLRTVNLKLYKNGKVHASTSLKLDGFTPLPQAFVKKMSKDTYYEIEAESGDRKSRRAGMDSFRESYRGYHKYDRCNIYKDKGAYNPGETLHFKAIVYNGDPELKLEVVKGKAVKVILKDSEGKELGSKELKTNDWGSVSGEFALPKDLRNGMFTLEVEGLASDIFRVDEFVLPTFTLKWDDIEKLYLTGDEIPVSGRLESYSGHNLDGVTLKARVECMGRVVLEQVVPVQADNSFGFTFPTRDAGYYATELTVTESTGETQVFHWGHYVGDHLTISGTFPDSADAGVYLAGSTGEDNYKIRGASKYLIETHTLRLKLQTLDNSGNQVPVPVKYTLYKEGSKAPIAQGETPSGELLTLDLPEGGLYRVHAKVSVSRPEKKDPIVAEEYFYVFSLSPEDKAFTADVQRFFVSGPLTVAPGAPITARFGAAEGDAYAVVTIYGKDKQVLKTLPVRAVKGQVEKLSFDYEESWPDAVRLQVFYFFDGNSVTYERQYRREKDRYTLPLEFTAFQDKAYPGVEYSFKLKTAPDAEALVAAWDKSLDAIAHNNWPLVHMRSFSVDNVYITAVPGGIHGSGSRLYYDYNGPMVMKSTRALGRGAALESAVAMAAVVEEEAMVLDDAIAPTAAEADEGSAFDGVSVREEFSQALTFQPHLRPAEDGTLSFSFRTSDKLSTYYVRVYAHDPAMRNAVAEKEMVVSLPVKASIAEPRFLYGGDVYEIAVSVSSIVEEDVPGTILLKAGDTEQQLPVTVPAGKTLSRSFKIVAPSEPGDLVLTAGFKADAFTDAVRVTVPVYEPAQTLTEAHSAVLHSGEDRDALIARLRSQFVNVPGAKAALKEITVLDMVKDAIPSHVEPSGKDVLSLSEAWYIRLMAGRLGVEQKVETSSEELLEKILACRNADGGFGWFEGMSSSAIITAVMLERMAKLRDRGFEVPDMSATVKYLDANQFDTVRPYWCGWVSDAQYLHIRSLYPDVPFKVNTTTVSATKRMKEFKKWAKNYLTPSKKDGRGLKGQILEKSRRLLTLKNLMYSDKGIALAKAWGISFGTKSALEKSMKDDISSLVEYAVEHRDGGWYYPNAVMPWRGLMESEAYAHALLCDLLSGVVDDGRTNTYSDIERSRTISNGIRIWLMLQKETQKWDTEPAYIDAVTSILDGPQHVLDTRVVALEATYRAPFEKIKAAGNGFTVERQFFKEVTEERLYDDKSGPNDQVSVLKEIAPGDPVNVGDKIVVKYKIWNGENRSFVRVTAGREASLQPVQQLSGHIGRGFIVPRRGGYVWSFTPQGYRNVKASETVYYFDSYPEENTTLSEEFFVVRAGTFQAPVTVIESLYAPHYRANSNYRAPLVSHLPETK